MSGIGTALPVIVADLHGKQFEWVGSAYTLSATAFLPMSGALAQVFGRRIIMLMQIFYFSLGCVLCGASTTLGFLIAGRTIQGVGVAGIASLSQIIIADLVPLQERGTYNGLVALAFGFGTAIAPVVSGVLAQHGQWRWFFYMNLPICLLTAVIAGTYLDLKVPRLSFKEKIMSLDWVGNILVIASTTAVVIALTWGGVEFSWSSPKVLVPLIIGCLGLIIFMVYEAKVADTPLVPLEIITARTTISGYAQAFFGNFYLLGTIFYLPTYFQACKDATPTRSGIDVFGLAFTIMPFGIVAGLSVAKFKCYRPQLWVGWVCLIVGAALMSTLNVDSTIARAIGFQIITGLGLGILLTTGFFPVLAPLKVEYNASALAFFMFVRWFSQIWGVTAGGTVLQNKLTEKLPDDFISKFPGGTSIAYSVIPLIPTLPSELKREVQDAFAEGLRSFWLVLVGISCAGLLSSLFMEGLPLHTEMDKDWGLKENNKELSKVPSA
ncbi:MFS general substrate transporter [Pyrrhoderma noxium]|uniref:MFS general substrate transporter n=1 Tax=Pyrrhoderma noxium TaxID=2282107 RepID=A0A286UPY8_9AGAM|nr:MFS general substrate transporter [Pyrrhoderma noxium]